MSIIIMTFYGDRQECSTSTLRCERASFNDSIPEMASSPITHKVSSPACLSVCVSVSGLITCSRWHDCHGIVPVNVNPDGNVAIQTFQFMKCANRRVGMERLKWNRIECHGQTTSTGRRGDGWIERDKGGKDREKGERWKERRRETKTELTETECI